MKVKLIATATNLNDEGFLEFKKSLDYFQWDYDIITDRYVAYGSKMINAYNYAKKTDCTHLFIVDAYDIFMLGGMDDALEVIPDKDIVLFNAEKACWPHSELASQYPEVTSPWKYVNGGACFVEKERFIKLIDENPIKHTDNDQEKLTDVYLKSREKYNMQLDTDCELFQSIAHRHDDDFEFLDFILINKKTGSLPIIIHGNGKTNMEDIYNLL